MDNGTGGEADAAGAGDELAHLAVQTLEYFEDAATAAEQELLQMKVASPNALANVNTLTGSAMQTLTGISDDQRRNLEAVMAQPAIARVEVLDESGRRETIFITPGGAPRGRWGDVRVASYRSPIGRLAAIRIGQDLDIVTPGGRRSLELVARAQLHPNRSGSNWDSQNTVLEALRRKPLTIVSLRALLRGPQSDDAALALLQNMLRAGVEEQNVFEGLRRSVLDRIGFRERPVLDEYQDEVFRLPLASRVAILGPPGSGKTTTLIKRLGLKVDLQVLEDDRAVVERTRAGAKDHASSWLMFSPAELLRQYVREAFNRERVPASDHQLQVWEVYRRETARNRLGILRTTTSSGGVLKEALQNLRLETLSSLIAWYEDFDAWQKKAFWDELTEHAARVSESREPRIMSFATRLGAAVRIGATRDGATPFVEFRAMSRDVRDRATELQREIDERLQHLFARELQKDSTLLARLSTFLVTLGDGVDPDDTDELDLEEDEEEVPTTGRAAVQEAFDAYLRSMRILARALATGRRLNGRSRHTRLREWLGHIAPSDDDMKALGEVLLITASLRRLANPMRAYLNGVAGRYRRFRRVRLGEGTWYAQATPNGADLGPLEVDVVMLAMLKAGRMLLADPRIAGVIDEDSITSLQAVRDLFRTQILVDEATDFSPIQLACMGALCDPAADAFLACGDFNQRITEWGTRSAAELRWVFSDIDVRRIHVTYRHSRQLNLLAHRIAMMGDSEHELAALPEHLESDGVDPVIGFRLTGTELVSWLRDRIVEIEKLTRIRPSIAILVNTEAEVQPLADQLGAALEEHNIPCAACPAGLVRGNDNDVRIFDVRHIKGLEFEAVFFVGIDDLAAQRPELFDKFLYVGATRAAMYFGLTTGGEPPPALVPLVDSFKADWR